VHLDTQLLDLQNQLRHILSDAGND